MLGGLPEPRAFSGDTMSNRDMDAVLMLENKKLAAEYFRKGNEAIPDLNWDFAIQMYREAVKLVPDNLMYRQTLRATAQKKYDGNGTGNPSAIAELMAVRTKIKQARRDQAWAALDEAAEEGLAINPWDAQLNADVGDACRELGCLKVAIFAYEESLRNDPTNFEVESAIDDLRWERDGFQ